MRTKKKQASRKDSAQVPPSPPPPPGRGERFPTCWSGSPFFLPLTLHWTLAASGAQVQWQWLCVQGQERTGVASMGVTGHWHPDILRCSICPYWQIGCRRQRRNPYSEEKSTCKVDVRTEVPIPPIMFLSSHPSFPELWDPRERSVPLPDCMVSDKTLWVKTVRFL